MPRRRSRRLQRYVDLGFILEEWAITEPEAAERDAKELAKLEAEEGPLVLPPGRGTWRGVASVAETMTAEGGIQTVITDIDGTRTFVAGRLDSWLE
jgi:hypothetical protein